MKKNILITFILILVLAILGLSFVFLGNGKNNVELKNNVSKIIVNNDDCDYENSKKKYLYKSLEECTKAFISCEEGGEVFSDKCGCGCKANDDTIGGEFILYSKNSGWGPCPPENTDGCKESITIYNTGKVMFNEKESSISVNGIIKVEEIIRETGIREKECDYIPVIDYWATHYIHSKKISFPGCEGETDKIDEVVAGIITDIKEGSVEVDELFDQPPVSIKGKYGRYMPIYKKDNEYYIEVLDNIYGPYDDIRDNKRTTDTWAFGYEKNGKYFVLSESREPYDLGLSKEEAEGYDSGIFYSKEKYSPAPCIDCMRYIGNDTIDLVEDDWLLNYKVGDKYRIYMNNSVVGEYDNVRIGGGDRWGFFYELGKKIYVKTAKGDYGPFDVDFRENLWIHSNNLWFDSYDSFWRLKYFLNSEKKEKIFYYE
jgi:hypothetical protein